jgi:hypothetical protein
MRHLLQRREMEMMVDSVSLTFRSLLRLCSVSLMEYEEAMW